MKNHITKNHFNFCQQLWVRMLAVLAVLATGFTAQADIINPTATSSSSYVVGSTTNIMVTVSFASNTLEWGDNVEFVLPGGVAGVTMTHGIPSPSPYTACGNDTGDEYASGSTVGWGDPTFPAGNSGCGPFTGIPVVFGLSITSDGMYTGSLDITVNIIGDGFDINNPNAPAGFATTMVTIPAQACMIVCPTDITVSNDAGECGAQVNIPLPANAGCTTPPTDMSGYYEVGTHEVTFTASDVAGVQSSCTMVVIVEDDEDPEFGNCVNFSETLVSGQCGVTIFENLQPSDNCTNPAQSMAQHLTDDIDVTLSCPGGPNHYLRVFDMDGEGVNTEFNVESIEIGVLDSENAPVLVTVNLYSYDGVSGLDYSNFNLLASADASIPDLIQTYYDIPISATVANDSFLVVEIVAPGSEFGGLIVGSNFGGETADSYIYAPFCDIETISSYTSLGFGTLHSIINVHGYQSSYLVENLGGAPELGDEFTEGNYNLSYQVTDAAGNTALCDFTVMVEGFADPISSISCNDEVQISLDEDCMAVVGADQVLEGGGYGCYDDYIVTIEDQFGNDYGNLLDDSAIGLDLTVTVTDPNGNSCWGHIVLEDKAPPVLDCSPVYTTCTGSTTPGAPISSQVTFAATIDDPVISDVGSSSHSFDIDVFGINAAVINDINFVIDISHSWVSDLSATLTSPSGTSVELFLGPGGFCGGDDIQVTMDDEAMMTYADLQSTCEPNPPAISGAFQPQEALSAFDGEMPMGTWTVTINDFFNFDGGFINKLNLVIGQSGGIISFPTTNDVNFSDLGGNTFELFGHDPCGPSIVTYNDDVELQDCESPYTQIIQRTWNAIDESGNASLPCIQTVYVFRNDLSTLMFPPNYDGIQLPALSCTQYGDNVPGPDVTGFPTGEICDNVQIFPYEDTRIDICQGSYKIIRQWRLLEWCSGEVLEHTQIIKVVDEEGPVLDCPDDLTISASTDDCVADYLVVKPEILFDCSDEFTYSVRYLLAYNNGPPPENELYFDQNVVYLGNGDIIIRDLPFGKVWIKYIVEDECGNTSECFNSLTINDEIAPVAVCDEFTVVGIGSDGFSEVYASTFDDGSWDNCGIVSMEAAKMTNQCAGENTAFKEVIKFCCAEVGTTIMVQFRVTDEAGNSNTCMVEVSVQDKLPPYITECPADITINCQDDYEDLEVTGEPVYIDNCAVVDVGYVDSGDLDQCGNGVITRTWTVTDGVGLKNSCVQYITLQDDDPFTIQDITWPNDYTAFTCGVNLDPENLPAGFAFPIVQDDNCSLVGMDYKDQVFNFVEGACVKILRTWTVIDWCTYDPNSSTNGNGYYEHLQIIKLHNSTPPEFIVCQDITLDGYEEGCQSEQTLTTAATDDCTPEDELNYSWEIDLDNDGTINLEGSGSSVTRTFDNGTHKIIWRVEDKCGNPTVCMYLFTVRDAKNPTPYCISSITTAVMNNNGMIQIWASDFDFGSYDNCTPDEELIFSFSSNPNQTSMTFDCDDIPDGESMYVPLNIWVFDNEGNKDFCDIGLILQDNTADFCDGVDGEGKIFVSGKVTTEGNEPIEDAMVVIESSAPEFGTQMMTSFTGNYTFDNLDSGHDYFVNSEKNDDVRNGVSTLDLVLIQRHILGLSGFNTAYKVIASDINDDDKVSAADLIALRKVILGVEDEFPNGQTSWRFITDQNEFVNINKPFPFLEVYDFMNATANQTNRDFVGVKIGDVNGTAQANINSSNSEVRNNESLDLIVKQQRYEAGQMIEVPVYAHNFDAILGYQFTLNFDADAMMYAGFESGAIALNESNFGMNYLDRGQLTTSWNTLDEVSVDSEEALFTMFFIVDKDLFIDQVMSISSEITSAEAYNTDTEVMDVNMTFRDGADTELVFELFQNEPNPFNDLTTIGFVLPEASDVRLTIYDVNGKLIKLINESHEAGVNTIQFRNDELNVSGVMYYQLDAGKYTSTKKMISIK